MLHKIIINSESFKSLSSETQKHVLSPSVFPILENAFSMKGIYTYEQWVNTTCAGIVIKQIVKELFSI